MIDYKLLNLAPEVPEGHEFSSDIPNLQDHPELWQEECPYAISDKAMSYVKIVVDNIPRFDTV